MGKTKQWLINFLDLNEHTPLPPPPEKWQDQSLDNAFNKLSLNPDNRPPQPQRPTRPPRKSDDHGRRPSGPSHDRPPRRQSYDAPRPSTATVDTQSTPTKPGRKRASSVPADAGGQCAGRTKKGDRCGRQVKASPLWMGGDLYCFQHQKDLLQPSGFYGHTVDGADVWIKFEDYIPSWLQPETQALLRVEMAKARSKADEEGYIYVFEIRDPADKDHVQLKVGRTVNVVKRLNEWGKQCGSKEQVLRGWFPGKLNEESLLKGTVVVEEDAKKDVWCHRLERLIHLELADIAVNAPYLEAGWKPFVKGKGKGKKNTLATTVSPKMMKGAGKGNGGSGLPCKDCTCRTVHKEIFEFQRVKSGPYKGREFDAIVKRIVDDWGEFVRTYV
ncbi:hypothetical protein CYLTODRAFT_355702 [Cylindrobasidium torrendii FP15055 ss-10]|uniref:DUF1766-domain-containing protein n=1 Tax=Cylindrobasidium torrendii FP15055 ss-10 TaxID=1314674 RepID=A0A0D7B956_9AGAR|nr:hypothetical protein CYLTODRAFT_355702 [Cylindrobasidium torrendii FP15055 ss-10]